MGSEELGIGTDIQGLDVTQKATPIVITLMIKYWRNGSGQKDILPKKKFKIISITALNQLML